jgi:hypothetical protein
MIAQPSIEAYLWLLAAISTRIQCTVGLLSGVEAGRAL